MVHPIINHQKSPPPGVVDGIISDAAMVFVEEVMANTTRTRPPLASVSAITRPPAASPIFPVSSLSFFVATTPSRPHGE